MYIYIYCDNLHYLYLNFEYSISIIPYIWLGSLSDVRRRVCVGCIIQRISTPVTLGGFLAIY